VPVLIVMRAQASEDAIARVCEKIERLGFRAHVMPGAQRTAIGITGNQGRFPKKNSRICPASPRRSAFPSHISLSAAR